MTKTIKFLIGAAVVGPALLASSAFAATIPATTVFSGQTDVYGNAGTSVTATFRVNVPTGEVVHAIRTKVDSQATVCTEVGPFEGNQDVDVPVSIVLPPNSGAYNLTAELFTTATLPQAEAMTGNLACTGTNSNAYNGSNVIHVLPVSGSTSGTVGGSWQDAIAALTAQIQALLHPAPAPTPVPTTNSCTDFMSISAGLSFGSDTRPGGTVGKLQSYLMYKGYDIPLLSANQAPYGYFGSQTAAAATAFRANPANQCN